MVAAAALLAVLVCGCLYAAGVFGERRKPLKGCTLSILGDSISTYRDVSNRAAAETSNSTIAENRKYYPHNAVPDVALEDTWWSLVCRDLDLRLLTNNSWSSSCLLTERSGTPGAWRDRCVQLHDDTGDNAGEEPDIIAVQMGTNDIQYAPESIGTADIDYDALISKAPGGGFTYREPATAMEAAAVTLHKILQRYPHAEVYFFNLSRRNDEALDALADAFSRELEKVCAHFGVAVADVYHSEITPGAFDDYIGDGRVHPNRAGMAVYARVFEEAVALHTRYATGPGSPAGEKQN